MRGAGLDADPHEIKTVCITSWWSAAAAAHTHGGMCILWKSYIDIWHVKLYTLPIHCTRVLQQNSCQQVVVSQGQTTYIYTTLFSWDDKSSLKRCQAWLKEDKTWEIHFTFGPPVLTTFLLILWNVILVHVCSRDRIMCRLMAYVGPEILVADVVLYPSRSIIKVRLLFLNGYTMTTYFQDNACTTTPLFTCMMSLSHSHS